MITDFGIELVREVCGRAHPTGRIAADRTRLRIQVRLVGTFLGGGIVGAVGFARTGLVFALPLAAVLLALSVPALLRRRRSV